MFKLRWLLLLLAFAMAGAVGFVVQADRGRTPEALLESALQRLQGSEPDYRAALWDFDLAFNLADARGNDELAEEILRQRALACFARRMWQDSRDCYVKVYEDYAPGDLSTLLQVGWIDMITEEYDSAIEIADSVLAEKEDHAGALHLKGKTLQTLAAVELDRCREALDSVLADQPAERGMTLVWRAAALDPGDPQRSSALSELQTLVQNGKVFGELNEAIDASSDELVTARRLYAKSLFQLPTAGPMIGLLEIFQRAGRKDEMVDLGLAAVPHPGFQHKVEAVTLLAGVLEDMGRPDQAAHVIRQAQNDEGLPHEDILLDWCRLLFELRDWEYLDKVSRVIDQRKDVRGGHISSAMRFFGGISAVNLKRYDRGTKLLERFTNSPDSYHPVEDSRPHAFYALAQAYRAQGKRSDEIRTLRRTTIEAPSLSGDAWLRLSQLQRTNGEPLKNAAVSLTHAIRMLPDQAEALFPEWEELSKEAMVQSRRNVEGIRSNQREMDRWAPTDPTVPYEYWALADLYLSENQGWGAIQSLNLFLDQFPGFGPAMDYLVDVHLRRGEYDKAARVFVDRMTDVGPHPRALEVLARIPRDVIAPELFLEMMESDPSNTGVTTMAREMIRAGRDDLALLALTEVDPARMQDEALLLLAEVQADRGAWGEALSASSRIPATSPLFSEALDMRARAALGRDSDRGVAFALDPVLARLDEAQELDTDLALGTATTLLLHGEERSALTLLRHLDADPETRSERGLVLLGAALTRIGGIDAAAEHFDRAQAFGTGPDGPIGRVIGLAEAGRWPEVPEAVTEIRRSEVDPDDLFQTVLIGLQERTEEARDLALKQLEKEPADPRWYLVLATSNALLPVDERRLPAAADPFPGQTALFAGGEDSHDPRWILVFLLALESEPWSAWVHAELEALSPTSVGELWPAYLQGLALENLGRDEARGKLDQVCRRFPTFPWSWDLLVDLARRELEDPFEKPYVNLLTRRHDALAGVRSQVEKGHRQRAIVGALRLRDRGEAERGIQALGDAMLKDGEDADLLLLVARMQEETGQISEAIQTWTRLLEVLDEEGVEHYVPEFLAMLERAYGDLTLDIDTWTVLLDALILQRPADPAVALARAKVDILTHPVDPVRGLGVAFERLSAFRETTQYVPIESLRRDASHGWFEIYLEHDPPAAEAFARAERIERPGSWDLWHMVGQAIEAQGDHERALEQYTKLIRIVPASRTLRRTAGILADQGVDVAFMQTAIQQIQAAEKGGPDPELALLLARTMVNAGSSMQDAGIEALEKLWEQRRQYDGLDEARLGRYLGSALLHRADPADGPKARLVLLEVLPRTVDPVEADLVLALANLARWIPQRRDPDPIAGMDELLEESEAEAGEEDDDSARAEGGARPERAVAAGR